MTIVHNSSQLRNDRSSQAIGAMEEYLAHGPDEHGAPGDPVSCRLPACQGETFPCRRRTAIDNWLFVPRQADAFDGSRVVYRGYDTGNDYRRPRPDRPRVGNPYVRR